MYLIPMQGIRKVGRINTFSDDDHYNRLNLIQISLRHALSLPTL